MAQHCATGRRRRDHVGHLVQGLLCQASQRRVAVPGASWDRWLCVAGSFDKMKDFFDTSETDTILQFIRDELDDVPDDHIEVDTPLFRSRLLDSMNLLSLITFLEARFAIAISSADVVFENLDSVQHIVAFVARKRAIIPSA